MPNLGETVHVWPHPGVSVRSHAELNRTLPPEGMALPWSPWLDEQLGHGAIHLTDPAPKSKPAPASKQGVNP